ncbi:MAG TPA: thioredoxin family protein [Terriglobales bacterium]|nr:thioredoxin family protein [Terriglobales bacterium]
MNATRYAAKLALALVVTVCAPAQSANLPDPHFAPFEQWKAAILAGDGAALRSFYSTDPPARVSIGTVMHDASADVDFWLRLKPVEMKTEVVRNEPRHGHISYIFRAQVQPASGPALNLTEDQSWQQQGSEWKLIEVERTDAPELAQPANMKKDIYPANADAHAEIREAEAKAATGNKRLLLVFGANWCFDCHVLDLAFHRPDIAPILTANYVVVHVDLGPDEQKNADLVQRYQIPLNKGIPALAIAESDGRLVVSQKNGEFEDARGLTPEVLLRFLTQWKPARSRGSV